MIALLVAYSGNDLQIPCMIFKTLDDGLNHIKTLFGVEEIYKNTFFVDGYIIEDNTCNYASYFKFLDMDFKPIGKEILATELFIKYNSSNGGCNGFSFIEVSESNYNKPLIRWKMD